MKTIAFLTAVLFVSTVVSNKSYAFTCYKSEKNYNFPALGRKKTQEIFILFPDSSLEVGKIRIASDEKVIFCSDGECGLEDDSGTLKYNKQAEKLIINNTLSVAVVDGGTNIYVSGRGTNYVMNQFDSKTCHKIFPYSWSKIRFD